MVTAREQYATLHLPQQPQPPQPQPPQPQPPQPLQPPPLQRLQQQPPLDLQGKLPLLVLLLAQPDISTLAQTKVNDDHDDLLTITLAVPLKCLFFRIRQPQSNNQ